MNRKGWIIFCLYFLTCNASAKCPDLVLTGLDNVQYELCEFIGAGKWTVVNIWGPKCPACIEEIPELVNFHDSNHEKDATVLGIALDFPSYGYAKQDDVAKVVDDYLVEYPNLLSDGEVAVKLGAKQLKGTPTNLIFSPTGEIVVQHVGIITKDRIEELITQYSTDK